MYNSSSLWSNRVISVHLRLALFIFLVSCELCTSWRSTPPITGVGSQVYTYDGSCLFIDCIMAKALVRGLHLLSLGSDYKYTPITYAHDSFIFVYGLVIACTRDNTSTIESQVLITIY